MAAQSKPIPIDDLLAHAEWLRGLAAHVVHGDEAAADLAQETWVAALRSPPGGDRPPRPWLAKVLRNFARRRARDGRGREARELAAADEATVPTPEALLERAEAQRLLAAAVVALPEPYRSTVLLRYYEGLTAVAIAAAHRLPEGTVRWRLKEALDRLRAAMEARHGGDRRAWSAVLLPLARPRLASSTLSGAALMATKTKLGALATALVLLALVGGGLVWRASRPRGPDPTAADGARRRSRAAIARPREILQAWERAQGGRPGTIGGSVLDADGRPAAGALVALVVAAAYEDMADKAALRPRATTTAATDGAYRFEQIPPGLYLLTATARGWAPAERTDVSLLPGEALQGLELRLARGGARLAGHVSDAGGGPIGGATLRALALGAGGRPEGARTFVAVGGADGAYEILLPRGSYRVVADADGYAPEGVKLLLDVDRTHDFRLAPAARISGRVVERGGGPVAAAEVRIDSERAVLRSTRADVSRRSTSDAGGAFVFAGVPAGGYRVSGRAGALVGRAERPVVVAPGGAALDVEVVLVRGQRVAGTVRDGSGRPIPGARVRAGDDGAAGITSADGRYALEGLPPGRHTLAAEAAGLAPARAPVVIDRADVDGVDLVLGAEARVEGRVLGRDGQPLPGASVTALVVTPDALADSVSSAAVGRSDSEGRFSLGGLGAGELRVEAQHPEAGRGVAGPVALPAGGRQQVEIRMGRGGLVRGTVLWDDRRPAVGAVVAGSQRRLPAITTATDEQGRYELGPFSPGELTVDARPETDALEHGGSGTEKRLTLASGEDRDGVDIMLARRDEEIAGVALAPDGRPVPGATIGVARPYKGVSYRPYNKYAGEADGPDYTVLSGPDGVFILKFLPKGTLDVWATHPAFPEADAYGVATGSRGVLLRFGRGALLAGQAVDRGGKPITTFTISAMLSQRNEASPTLKAARGYVQSTLPVQDAAGAFEIPGLHPALYDLLVTTPDGRGGRLTDLPVAAGEAKRGLRVLVGDTVRVKGRVLDEATRQPLAGVTVVASIAVLVSEVRARTGADGGFLLEEVVPGGTVGLTLRGDGRSHGVKRQSLEVPAGVPLVDAGTLLLAPVGPPAPAH
jgi:RNA polymerase sigma-70 factor (ECF subfamily)